MKHQDIRDKIHLTYLSLVSSQDASTINVRKLAEAAGIARSTFYIYFDNIEQLVIDIENEFLYQFEKLYKQHIRCPLTAPEHFEVIQKIICFLKENYHTFLILCGSQGSNSFVMKLVNTLKLLLVKKLNYLHIEYSEVQLTFAATGFMSVIDFLDTEKTTKENANHYKVKVEFKLLENQFLPFPDNTFDLVVSRDVTWMLQDAEGVLKEWYRVTKKGGKVLYFDANWYYYLFNENEKKKHLENQKMVQKKGGFIYNKSKIMENLAKVLPLSQKFRPDWDKEILPTLGYHNIVTISNVNSIVYTEKEQIQYASKPEFLVVAEK